MAKYLNMVSNGEEVIFTLNFVRRRRTKLSADNSLISK
jgi:hypothetical protein